jgi:hypothetical protein
MASIPTTDQGVRQKDARFVEAGRRGARRRWGEHGRIVRIDALTREQAAVVVALVAAQKLANSRKKAPTVADSVDASEVVESARTTLTTASS